MLPAGMLAGMNLVNTGGTALRHGIPSFAHSVETSLTLLRDWAVFAEADWSDVVGHPDFGVYGTGYNHWGVQTQQKYMAAMATLATKGNGIDKVDTQWALDRALAALRFSLASHQSGSGFCTDGTRWGHTWISALGIERMMFGVELLRPHFKDADLEMLERVMTSEAEWLLSSYQRGSHRGITGTRWAAEGGNDPESNIWNGALLWRAASWLPDHAHAEAWRERAHAFLINGVSISSDATDSRSVAGRPILERHIGPNFFDHYALDHHGYLNVGYMVICVSNAALLHFDLKSAGRPRPESLDHHQDELWKVLRRMIFSDGRLARIGGDTRVRYAYCQEYLLPSLLYAADCLGENYAPELIEAQLRWVQREADYSGDGSFYSRRLASIRKDSPQYYTRLESDRACALAMLAAYAPLVEVPTEETSEVQRFEQSVAGAWIEEDHGAALHRSDKRFASFSWRSKGLAQGLCLPPDDGHLAEWEFNLGGRVEFCHHAHSNAKVPNPHRRLVQSHVENFPGGFVSSGALFEGVEIVLSEGWSGTDSALHQIAFAALPDGRTVVGLNYCRMGPRRGYVASIKGLHYNLPNDLFNGFERTLYTANGCVKLVSPAEKEGAIPLQSPWANVENRLGLVGLYGAETLSLHRSRERRGGPLESLFVEEICHPLHIGPMRFEAGEIILDTGWAVLSGVDAESTRSFSDQHRSCLLETGLPEVRVLRVLGAEGRPCVLAANFGDVDVELSAGWCGDFPQPQTMLAGRALLLHS